MRRGLLLLAAAGMAAGRVFGLQNDPLLSWPSPDGRSLIREALCGEGRRVVPVFVNLATGHQTDFLQGGSSRTLEVLWSPNSRFVAVNADRSHHTGETRLYRVQDGRIQEISLPEGMEATRFLPPGRIGAIFYEHLWTRRWVDSSEVEIESAVGADLLPDGHADISHGFAVKIAGGEAKIVRSFPIKTGPWTLVPDGNPGVEYHLPCPRP